MPTLKERYGAFVERLSPRARQWSMVGLLGGVGVGLLWAVFSAGSGDSAQRAASAAKSDLKPTNVDLMAPGAQLKDSEVWIGKAGRELDRYVNDREEQRRINRQITEQNQDLMRRLGEMEARLKSAPDASRAASAPTAAVVPAPPVQPPKYPPDAALTRQASLPPPPPPPAGARGAMPPGAPGFSGPAGADGAYSPPQPGLWRVTLAAATKSADGAADGGKTAPQTLDTFLPVSFTRGVLLGGLDAPTGGQSQSNPHPVLIRLSDNSVLPNRYRAEYRECFVIAAGYGDISSERAYLRTESLSCVRKDGTALEVKIQGSVYGEDGKVGMRGRLVTKQGQMLANALMAGVMSGIGQGIATANTTYSTSALGSVATASGRAFRRRQYSGRGHQASPSAPPNRLAFCRPRLLIRIALIVSPSAFAPGLMILPGAPESTPQPLRVASAEPRTFRPPASQPRRRTAEPLGHVPRGSSTRPSARAPWPARSCPRCSTRR